MAVWDFCMMGLRFLACGMYSWVVFHHFSLHYPLGASDLLSVNMQSMCAWYSLLLFHDTVCTFMLIVNPLVPKNNFFEFSSESS